MDFANQLYKALDNHGLAIEGSIDFSKNGFQRFRIKNSNKSDKPIFISIHTKGVSFGDWRDRSTWKTIWKDSNKIFSPPKKIAKPSPKKNNLEEAFAILNQCHDATPDHPYVEKKRIIPYYGKQVGDQIVLPVIKCTKNGLLPVIAITGKFLKEYSLLQQNIISLQLINSNGNKKFLKNCSYKNGFVLLNDDLNNLKTIWICEGWATGCSIKEVTNEAVACALSANNLVNVALVLRRTLPNCKIKIAADHDDVGLEAAYEASKLTGAKIFYPTNYKTDFNDLYVDQGFDGVSKALGYDTEAVCKKRIL